VLRVNPIRNHVEALDYYATLSEEARLGRAVDDYYLGEGVGEWEGKLAEEFGIAGKEVDRVHLERLFDGRHPISGEQLRCHQHSRAVSAFDLTFSAPKSVSVLAALYGGWVERALVEAHDAAVKAVLRTIESQTYTRAGKGGLVRMESAGLAYLLVRHRTSRSLDPQLHHHVLVLNLTRGGDGKWRTVDARTWYKAQRAYGAMYRAALRREVAKRMPGLQWRWNRGNTAEIAGMEEFNALFSSRVRQVEARFGELVARWEEEHPGEEMPEKVRARKMEQAVLETRPPKDRARKPEELREQWRKVALEHGLDGRRLRLAFEGKAGREELGGEPEEIAKEAVEILQAEQSAWSRADLMRVIGERLGAGGGDTKGGQASCGK